MPTSRATRRLVLGVGIAGLIAVAVVAVHRSSALGARSGDETRTISSQGRTWQYLFHRPSTLPASQRAPLVIALHGAPDTPQAMAARTRFDTFGDRFGFLVAYPNFPLTPGGDENGGPSKIQVVADLIDTLEQGENVDPNRVFVTGFSGGAIMSYRMACFYANKVAAIASVAGVIIRPECSPSQPVSIYEIHGTSDGSVPYNGGPYTPPVKQTIDRWLGLDRCPSTPTQATIGPVQRETWGPCANGTAVQFDTVVKGEHAWPGDPRYPHGTPDGDFDASPAIWQFFAAHGRTPAVRPLAAALLGARVLHVGKTRTIVATLRGAAQTSVTLSLLQAGKARASVHRVLASTGTTVVRLRILPTIKAGSYRLSLHAGTTKQSRPLRLPAP